MTTDYLMGLFDNPNRTIRFGITNPNLLLQLEDLLLNNGYRWKCRDKKYHFFRDEYMINNNVEMVILNINLMTDEPMILSMNTYVTISEIEDSTIIITEDSLKKIKLYFNPIPDYKPKKFIREI
jgi:hypothetical protein